MKAGLVSFSEAALTRAVGRRGGVASTMSRRGVRAWTDGVGAALFFGKDDDHLAALLLSSGRGWGRRVRREWSGEGLAGRRRGMTAERW